MKDKIKYEKPKLISLNGYSTSTEGVCVKGTGDSDACGNGTSAGSGCANGYGVG